MARVTQVVFVCLHGSAKSLIAAEHFRRLAGSRGLDITTASAGVEPDATIPPHVIAGLGADGIDVASMPPARVTDEILAAAHHVVSFGCDLSAFGTTGGSRLTRWDDMPAVSDGYDTARDAIVARLHGLLDEVAADSNHS